MRMRPLSTGLAGLTVCFAGVAAITAQDHPTCVAIAEQLPAAREALFQTKIEPPATVTIVGEVLDPCTAAFWEGMTLGDLITQAGRLNQTANLTLEVYRVIRTADGKRLVIPEIHSIRVDSTYLVNHVAGRIYAAYIPGFTYMVDRAMAFKLSAYDRVVVLALRPTPHSLLPIPPGGGRREEGPHHLIRLIPPEPSSAQVGQEAAAFRFGGQVT